jgi:hypothetical protein
VGGDARWQCVPALWRDVLSAGGCCLPAPLVHAVLLAAAAVSLHRVSESAPLQSDMALHASLQWELPRGIDDAAYVNAVGVRHAQQGVAGVDAAVLLDMFRGLFSVMDEERRQRTGPVWKLVRGAQEVPGGLTT